MQQYLFIGGLLTECLIQSQCFKPRRERKLQLLSLKCLASTTTAFLTLSPIIFTSCINETQRQEFRWKCKTAKEVLSRRQFILK